MKIQIALVILVYLALYFIRFEQGGWKFKVEMFKDARTKLDQQIIKYLPSPQAELLSGILLGQNKALPGQLKLSLRDTSTLHIVVASGQNLTMVGGFFILLSGLIKRKLAITLSFAAVISYIFLTGAQIPILRAGIMVGLTYLANLIGREKDGPWVLLITAGMMLLVNPNWLFELSFQLSVLATFGVVVVAPLILERVKFLPLLNQDLAVSLGAQLMVLPIIAQNFHQLSLVALPANILVLWTIPFIMIGGAILLLLSFISPPLTVIMGFFLNILLTYFIYIVNFFAGFNWAWIYIGEYSWIVWIGYYLIVAAILKIIYDLQSPKES